MYVYPLYAAWTVACEKALPDDDGAKPYTPRGTVGSQMQCIYGRGAWTKTPAHYTANTVVEDREAAGIEAAAPQPTTMYSVAIHI